MDNELSLLEQNKLEDIEGRIEKGARNMYCGLIEVYDQKLWRASYESFVDYCEKRWGISKTHCYRILAASRTMANLEGKIEDDMPMPTIKEAEALSKVPEEEQAEKWQETVKEKQAPAPLPAGAKPVTVPATAKIKLDLPAEVDVALKLVGKATRKLADVAELAEVALPNGIVECITDLNTQVSKWKESL